MAGDVRVVLDERGFADITGSAEMRVAILDAAQALVPGARGRAPKETGAGAASIHAEPFLDDGEWTARMSWAREMYYLRFSELGTRTLPARPFLSPEGGV